MGSDRYDRLHQRYMRQSSCFLVFIAVFWLFLCVNGALISTGSTEWGTLRFSVLVSLLVVTLLWLIYLMRLYRKCAAEEAGDGE